MVIKIAFTGDVMLGRLVNELLIEVSPEYVWGDMLNEIKKADVRVINQEFVFTESEEREPRIFNFKSDPKNIQCLLCTNIDLVNLANNHALDFKERGLIDTLQALKAHGIKYVGAGKNIKEAAAFAILEKNNIRIAVIGLTDNVPEWEAAANKSGVHNIRISLEPQTLERIGDIIREARRNADIVVLSAHWGPNMRAWPTREFISFAHMMIDLGADIFHGHSAHIFQGIEIYNGKPILYDTGDFIDDYAVDPELRNDWTFLFLVEMTKDRQLRSIELIPALISNRQVNKAIGIERELIIDRMKSLCAGFGTKLEERNGKIFVEK